MSFEEKKLKPDLINEPKKRDLLKNSSVLLKQFRETQAKRLKLRLDFFVKSAIDKYGSIESIDKSKKMESSRIESKNDIDIINRIVNIETFVTIPVFTPDGKLITHFYTIGMWYYWGLPELFIKFSTPLEPENNVDFAGVIINIIHDHLFYKYKEKIIGAISNSKRITRIDFKKEPSSIYLSLDGFDINIKMKRVDEQNYMDLKAYFLLWFYMYYVEAEIGEDGEPKLYPVYRIDLKTDKYPEICKKITESLMLSAMSKINESNNDPNINQYNKIDNKISDKSDDTLDDLSDTQSVLSDILEEESENTTVENLDNE